MALFHQSEIDQLISCPKEILEAPAKELRLVGAYWRNGGKLVASDGTRGTFSVFMRRNEDFPENFSIGLIYNANDGRGEITLFRCNGKHGVFNGGGQADHPHWDFHIYRATEMALEAGFVAEKYAEKTNRFASYEQAIGVFLQDVELTSRDRSKFYSAAIQVDMFDGGSNERS